MAGRCQLLRAVCLVAVAVALSAGLGAACPAQCSCDSWQKAAECADSELDHVPAGLPDSLLSLTLELPQLRELSADSLAELDAPQLLRLELSGGGLESVHNSAFSRVPQLQALNLTGNRLVHLNPDAFPESLDQLELSGNPLQLPSSGPLLRASNLTMLILERCGLTELPPQLFAELPQLRILWLGENQLTQLGPGALESAPKLEVLNLRGNTAPLRLHPDALAANKELAWLNLESANVQLPEEGGAGDADGDGDGRLINSASLRGVHLADNGLAQLPAGLLRGLPELTRVTLSLNGLRSLPDGLFEATPKLKELHLDGNRLTLLPAALLAPLPELVAVSLSNNSLGPVPAARPLLYHPTLYELLLGENGLKRLPVETLAGVPQLRYLQLYGNPEFQLDREQLGPALPQLEQLSLSDNPRVCPCVQEEFRTGWQPGNRTLTVFASCGEFDWSPPC